MNKNYELLMEVIDPITDKYLESGFGCLNDIELVLLSVWMLEVEVNNGGFNQFYWNSAGDVANQVVHSLQKIGAPKTAEIVSDANRLFGEAGPPLDRQERQSKLEEIAVNLVEEFESLDLRFYEYPHNLEELMYQYAKTFNKALHLTNCK